MARVIVERRFDPPLSQEQLSSGFSRMEPCLHQHGVRWLHSHISTDRTRMICEFEAPDAEAVRMAHLLSGMPFERVWPAEALTPEAELILPGGGR